uniref:BIG2 domain-containing protein n=1 Tax=Strigamia maritima TaxID=126957 RepID=T1JBD5_STRMM
MANVVFLHPDLGIGGAERVIVDAAMTLKNRGHSVKILTAHHDPSHCFKETIDGSLDVLSVGDWLPRSIFGTCFALCAYIRMLYLALYLMLISRLLVDIVVVDQISACIPILKLFRVKVLFYCHFPDLLLTNRNTILKKLYRAPIDLIEEVTTSMADIVVVNTSIFKSTFTRIRTQPEVLYPSLDFTKFDKPITGTTSHLKLSNVRTLFLSINRYERKKNIGLALKAMSILRERLDESTWSGVHLVVAGGYDSIVSENVEYFRELEILAEALHLDSDHVSFLRSVGDEDKRSLLHHCRCLIYTPENEHFGIVPIEAMAMGRPVIAVNSGGPTETIENTKTGFLCDSNPKSFADAMETLARDKDLALELGQVGQKSIQTAMAATSKFVSSVLWFIILFYVISSSRLNVPRVLLPYSSMTVVNFTLEVSEGGCYKWKSIRPEIVSVRMLEKSSLKHCSTKAVVTVASRHPMRQTSLILAQDDTTGSVLHCDVIVDMIFALEIVRTTAELYLEDAPEKIIARAKDKTGDTFSSLDGLLFDWSLIADTDSDELLESTTVIRTLPFAKSKYDAPVSIKYLEQDGHEGYMILIEGKSTGSAKITTRLLDPVYKDILSEEITIFVVANVIINPAYDLYLIPGTRVHYKVERLQQGKAFEIEMPSEQFYLDIVGPPVITLDKDTCIITANEMGSTTVVLKDRNVKMWEPLRQPISRVNIVLPHHIEMEVEPYGNWLLELGKPYTILMTVFDSSHNEIYNSDDLRITLITPEETFQIISSTENGTYYDILPLKLGVARLEAVLHLTSLKSKMFSIDKISVSQEIEVCQPIAITPEMLVLPWDPISKLSQNMLLTASGGGTDNYVWVSENNNVATVNDDGELVVLGAGSVNITASSLRNPYIIGTSSMLIIPVTSLHVVTTNFETEIGHEITLPVALYGSRTQGPNKTENIAFTDCRSLAVKIEISDTKKFDYILDQDTSPTNEACIFFKLKSKSEGNTQVTIKYYTGETELKKTIVIASYKPLMPLLMKPEVVLALGSSKDVGFEGGPRAWVLKPESHVKNVSMSNTSLASATFKSIVHCKNRDAHLFTVFCKSVGKTTAILRVGNMPSTSLPKPLTAYAEISVVCGIPSSILLHPVIHRPSHAKGLCQTNTRKVSVQCYSNLELMLEMLDDTGRPFDNVTSLIVEWEISDPLLALRPEVNHLNAKWTDIAESNCLQTMDYVYENIKLASKEGSFWVKASIVGYNSKMDTLISLTAPVTNTLDIELVEDASISPENVAIFNHPDNIVFPRTDGSFTLTVTDLCLEVEKKATATVRVTGIKSIEVLMTDKVEVNKEIEVSVVLLDLEGQCLPVSVSAFTNLRAMPSSNIISVRSAQSGSKDPCITIFKLLGLQLGHTTLVFQANVTQTTQSKPTTHVVVSELLPVQVFSPLRIYPNNLTLIPGSIFQVTSSGGPQPQTHIEYVVENQSLATVSASGLISTYAIGLTIVKARAIGVSPESGTSIVFSEDEAKIHIVELKSIRIHTPLTRMKTGTEMLVYPIGMNEHEVPFSFGNAIPSLRFEWAVSDKDIISVHSIYEESGVVSDIKNSFVVRVIAKRPGQVTLSLKIHGKESKSKRANQIIDGKTLTDTLPIHVFEKLDLVFPGVQTDSILLTPNTELQLHSNRDSFTRVFYEVSPEGKLDSHPCITVERSGLLRTGQKYCQTTVMITAHEEFGVNQTINVLVEVKAASYLVLRSSTLLNLKNKALTSFPVGGSMTLHLSLHDNVGNRFHISSIFLSYRPNRFDLLEIIPDVKNTTYLLKALKSGVTIIKFWHSRNPRVETFVNFVTGDNIAPAQPLATVGDVICFSSPLLTAEGNSGTWDSDNGLVASVDPETGLAILNSVGSATIYYKVSPEFVLKTDVIVDKIRSVAILPPKFTHLTNVWPGTNYDVPLLLSAKEEEGATNILGTLGKNCSNSDVVAKLHHVVPFYCELSFTNTDIAFKPSEVFEVESAFDFKHGHYVCRVKSVVSTHARLALSTVTTDLKLRANVPIQGPQPSLASRSITLPFLSSFHVLVDEIKLTSVKPVGVLPISATDQVFRRIMVIVNDRSVLEILPEEHDKKSKNVRIFPVQLKDGCWDPGDAIFSLDIHLDSIKVTTIPVIVRFMEPGTCAATKTRVTRWSRYLDFSIFDGYAGYLIVLLSAIGTGIAILIGYWSMFGQGVAAPLNPDTFASQQTTRSYLFRPAGLPMPTTPQETSPPGRTLLWSEPSPSPPFKPSTSSQGQFLTPAQQIDFLHNSHLR